MKANKPKLTATYLYVDGHAVQCFEKTDPDAGEVNYCEVHEQFTKARCSFTGRIIFGHACRAAIATVYGGSESYFTEPREWLDSRAGDAVRAKAALFVQPSTTANGGAK